MPGQSVPAASTSQLVESSVADELYLGYIQSRGRLPSYSSRQQMKDLNQSLNLNADQSQLLTQSRANQLVSIRQDELAKL